MTGSIPMMVSVNGVPHAYAPPGGGSLEIRDAAAPLEVSHTPSLDIEPGSPPARTVPQEGPGVARAYRIVFGKPLSPSNAPLMSDQGDLVQLEDGTEQPDGVLKGEALTFSVGSAAR